MNKIQGWVTLLVITLFSASVSAEPHNVPIYFKNGLPHVTLEIVGFGKPQAIEAVVDTGSSSTVLPIFCSEEIADVEAGSQQDYRLVFRAENDSHKLATLSIDSLTLGGCQIMNLSVKSCTDHLMTVHPVLGMDVLRRLQGLKIILDQDSGLISFFCHQDDI